MWTGLGRMRLWGGGGVSVDRLQEPADWFTLCDWQLVCLVLSLSPSHCLSLSLCSFVSFLTRMNRIFQKDPDESWDCVLPPEARVLFCFYPDPFFFLHYRCFNVPVKLFFYSPGVSVSQRCSQLPQKCQPIRDWVWCDLSMAPPQTRQVLIMHRRITHFW